MKITNRRGLHNFHIIESFEVGIQLTGSEVKSIREGRIDLGQASVKVIDNQLFLVNAHIPQYRGSDDPHYQLGRSRRLLAHRSQINSLVGKLSSGGMSLVPVSIYEKNNLLKLQLGLGRSKKEFDKRRVVKERDHLRRIEQELRGKE